LGSIGEYRFDNGGKVPIGFKLRTRMLGARLWPERMAPERPSGPTPEWAFSAVRRPKIIVEALSKTLAAEQERWFPWSVAAFAGGIAAYFAASSEPTLVVTGAIALVAVASGVLGYVSTNTVVRFACALLAAAGMGFAAGKLRTERMDAPIIARDTGPVRVTGRIEDVEIRAANRARIVLAPSSLEDSDTPPARVRVTLIGTRAVETAVPGAHVSALAVLRPPPEPVLPHGYDFARWAYFQGIGGVGFTYGAPQPIDNAPEPTMTERFRASILAWRLAITKRVETAVPGPDGAIAAALITGTRASISEEDTEAYRDSGLAHVLSISGLHLGLAGLGIFFVVRALLALSPALALTQPIKKWAAVAAFFSASFYLLISGGGAPAVRSHLMLSAMLLGVIADRPALSMRAVAIAALLILAVTPDEIVNPGFQMSFAAVIGLIALAEWAASRPRPEELAGRVLRTMRKARRYVLGMLAASLVATLATTPFAIYHFDRAASYSLLANLLAEPIVAFVIMPSAAASVVMMPFGLEAGPLQSMGWGVHQITAIAHWVAGLPGASTLIRAWPLGALLGIVFGGLWIALWRRSWRWFGLAPIAASFVAIQLSTPADVFIARDAQSAAVRGEDGRLVILGARADEYTTAQWLLRDGDRRNAAAASAGASCDELGCVAKAAGGRTIALSLKIGALREDCARADILISAIPVRSECGGPQLVVDRFDVFRDGATALSFGADGIRVETVNGARGARPWSLRGQGDQ
jgi:competence protein ComEC